MTECGDEMMIVSGFKAAISLPICVYAATVSCIPFSSPRPISGTMSGGCGTIKAPIIDIVCLFMNCLYYTIYCGYCDDMSISFSKKRQVFLLNTPSSTYIIRIVQGRFLLHGGWFHHIQR